MCPRYANWPGQNQTSSIQPPRRQYSSTLLIPGPGGRQLGTILVAQSPPKLFQLANPVYPALPYIPGETPTMLLLTPGICLLTTLVFSHAVLGSVSGRTPVSRTCIINYIFSWAFPVSPLMTACDWTSHKRIENKHQLTCKAFNNEYVCYISVFISIAMDISIGTLCIDLMLKMACHS